MLAVVAYNRISSGLWLVQTDWVLEKLGRALKFGLSLFGLVALA